MTKESVAVPARPIALVVDDEPLILLDTSDIVTDAGYQVVEATTADQALAYLETHAVFDLLVTDIQMPGTMDGIALARHVGERWPHVKILVVSGAVIPLGGVLPKGARFIPKPLDRAFALRTLREFES